MIAGDLSSEVGQADFYFLNPAGILFGPDAHLKGTGSMHFSTADYLKIDGVDYFESPVERSEFRSPPPVAFGFLAPPAAIRLKNTHVEVNRPHKQITLSASDISLEDSRLDTSSGRIELFAISEAGEFDASSIAETKPAGGEIRIRNSGAMSENLRISGNNAPQGIELYAENIVLDNAAITEGTVLEMKAIYGDDGLIYIAYSESHDMDDYLVNPEGRNIYKSDIKLLKLKRGSYKPDGGVS